MILAKDMNHYTALINMGRVIDLAVLADHSLRTRLYNTIVASLRRATGLSGNTPPYLGDRIFSEGYDYSTLKLLQKTITKGRAGEFTDTDAVLIELFSTMEKAEKIHEMAAHEQTSLDSFLKKLRHESLNAYYRLAAA